MEQKVPRPNLPSVKYRPTSRMPPPVPLVPVPRPVPLAAAKAPRSGGAVGWSTKAVPRVEPGSGNGGRGWGWYVLLLDLGGPPRRLSAVEEVPPPPPEDLWAEEPPPPPLGVLAVVLLPALLLLLLWSAGGGTGELARLGTASALVGTDDTVPSAPPTASDMVYMWWGGVREIKHWNQIIGWPSRFLCMCRFGFTFSHGSTPTSGQLPKCNMQKGYPIPGGGRRTIRAVPTPSLCAVGARGAY
mmetsp:Transcript_11578/g.32873  ORF Transcript_11578/g.32873 Transcript_11578/m.32873 type:complete len:243 (-) Transcript_11578:48-776(-)